MEYFFINTEEKPSATAEKSTKQSPVKFMVKSKPFKFTKMIPAKPEIQPMIFPGVNFSCLKIRLAISSEKNAEVPLKIVPFTPEVLASPT